MISFIDKDDDDMDDVVIEEYLSFEKLRLATGVEDLDDVNFLEIIVDTTEHSLGNLGEKIPKLTQLKLNNSAIPCIRDLGTSLKMLQVLWISRCSLGELEGIAALPNLRELYASFNHIDDLSPVASLEKIQILDLEANQIQDISQIQFLIDCKDLSSLTLESNPVSLEKNYRVDVQKYLPQLKVLDDTHLSSQKKKGANRLKKVIEDAQMMKNLEEDQEKAIVNQSIKYTRVESADNLFLSKSPLIISVSTPKISTPLSARPSSAQSSVSFSPRPLTARERPSTASGFRSTSMILKSHEINDHEACSELTYGFKEIICGNPVKSLRNRKLAKKVFHESAENPPTEKK